MDIPSLPDGVSVYSAFIALHRIQLESSAVPDRYWKTLCRKLYHQIFDAGNTFSVARIEYDEDDDSGDYVNTYRPQHRVFISCEASVDASDPQHIYLIDHAWTYRVDSARQNLRSIPALLDRMAHLMGVQESADEHSEVLINKVFDEMWKFNQTYSVPSRDDIEESMPVWYVMDEFGSAIPHSDNPTFRTVPFIFLPDQITYTLLFPIENVDYGEEVTRDYIESSRYDSKTRDALLIPWVPKSFLSEPFQYSEPDSSYFLQGHTAETLPNASKIATVSVTSKDKILVFSQYAYVNDYLTHPKFEITHDEENADILWYTQHFKDFKEFSQSCSEKFVNQFPFEHVITVKDLLAIVCRRAAKESGSVCEDTLVTYPVWLPTTYNLKTELPKFVSYYQHRAEKGLDNHWICKPFNLARGLDTHITDNLNYILRLPLSGPKIAQKYIEDPVLFQRPDCGAVKFDLRYVLLVKSIKPLSAFVYRNFFLRFSNKPFDLNNLDDYEKHFTVMNYNENATLYRMLCDDFVVKFEQQYPSVSWKEIEEKIFSLFREMLSAASSKMPPAGIAYSPQSRAVYAADLMLAWQTDSNDRKSMQPKLLEVNWTPDCKRACEYYPDFYNDIFSVLFLDDVNERKFACLK
ncbi:tubulin--tyrosine ligase-like protein 12 [Schistocerca nitens]|uniref:tubulin--tyrosine ligase-like protein 12 n=1 Tax=Schistocerca nitens TaxID=7011 RepID=UPI002118A1D1|nr:tubulin--tyrosine ligase-like protein 12 [Schistocerca nitens]